MTTVIKRNNTLEDLLKYWNHNDPSVIGMGRLSRKLNDQGIYLITKTEGRQDLALFNINTTITVNGEVLGNKEKRQQLSLEPYGLSRSFKEQNDSVKLYIYNWIQTNKEELCIQLHYLNWFNKVEIKNLTVQEVIEVLKSYQYDQEEAEDLFNKIN